MPVEGDDEGEDIKGDLIYWNEMMKSIHFMADSKRTKKYEKKCYLYI